MIKEIFLLALGLIFTENIVFSSALGSGTLITMSGKTGYVKGFCLSAFYLTVVSTSLTFFVSPLLSNTEAQSIEPLVFIGILGIVYIVTLVVASRLFVSRFERLKKYIHVSAFNSVVLGSMVLAEKTSFTGYPELQGTFWAYFFYGVFTAFAFILAVAVISAVYPRLHSEKIPYAFRGYPSMLLFLGIIAMTI
ncbi:MAG: hypothetical protein LBM87_05690 [Ruminococcus sp.]|jgi:electron transport complex protein RnfA|nr:hypothetical protein [Ruminococcus sp.]